jgi:hypothetical protein
MESRSTGPATTKLINLIPLSLGGSNSIRNLWPHSTKTSPWNSYVKDALERKLHKLVCVGQLDLKTAQNQMASNWIEAYKKYVREAPPAPRVRSQGCWSGCYFENGRLPLLPCEMQRNSAGSSRVLAMHTRALLAVPLTSANNAGVCHETNLLTTMLGIAFV